MAEQSFFYPVHLALFVVISMETRNVSGVFIQILMTRFFELVTGNNFVKRWLQLDDLSSIASDASNNTNTSKPSEIKGRKSRVAGEQRVKNMQRKEKSAKS